MSRTHAIGSEVTTGGDLTLLSGGDQTYQGARLAAGGDLGLTSGGTIRFETASDVHTESHERSKSSFAWQSASGAGFTRETLRQSELVAQGELIIQAAEGIAIDAGVRSVIDGGSFRDHLGDGLEDALAHVVSGVLFHAVGDHAKPGSAEKVALHALVGGTVSEAMGGDFRSGALAAGASEALVDQLVENAHTNPVLSNTVAQLVGIVAAELAGGDINDGAWIAGQVESYNRQLHSEERMLARELAERGDGYTTEEIEQALRGMYHDGLGQSPGDNVIVDLQDLDAVDGAYFDYDGDWLATPGATARPAISSNWCRRTPRRS